MSSRAELVRKLAPVAPPCFATRSQWLAFLESAAEEQRSGHAKVIIILRPADTLAFNYQFNFCADCLESHRASMRQAGKCNPAALREVADAAVGRS